jgi:hypothetical protein
MPGKYPCWLYESVTDEERSAPVGRGEAQRGAIHDALRQQ